MAKEIASAFVAAARYTWKRDYGRDIATTSPVPVDLQKTEAGITFYCPFEGDLNGTFAVYADRATCDALIRGMQGMYVVDPEKTMRESLMETVRCATESGCHLIAKLGYNCTAGQPGLVDTRDEPFPGAADGQTTRLRARTQSEYGELDLILSLAGGVTGGEPASEKPSPRESGGRTQPRGQAPSTRNGGSQSSRNPRASAGARNDGGRGNDEPEDIHDVVRARRFELVSNDGSTRAVIGMLQNGSPT